MMEPQDKYREVESALEKFWGEEDLLVGKGKSTPAQIALRFRNAMVLLAAILFLLSLAPNRYPILRAVGYLFGAIAYICEIMVLTDCFKVKIPHNELFMPYCFGPASPNDPSPVAQAMSKAMEPVWAKGHYRVHDAIHAMASVPVAFEPGEDWLYGFGSEIIGGIVELLTDRKLSDAMVDFIFEPLGMHSSDCLFRDDLESRLVSMYAKKDGVFTKMPPEIDRGQRPGAENEEGRPSLMTNVRDFSKLMQLWAHDGEYAGKRLLQADTMRMMRVNRLGGKVLAHYQGGEDQYNSGYGYGYGVRTLLAPRAGCGSVGSYGWTGGYGTWGEADPVTGVSIVYMHNCMPNFEQALHLPVRAAAYEAIRGGK